VLKLLGDVTAVAWILGSAQGSDEELAAIHGPRLDRMMEKLVETPVRGFIYEAAGSVDPILLARGREAVDAAAETWHIPLGTLLADPNDDVTWDDPFEVWLESATNAVLGMADQER
jgi:hypothetical protein